MVANKGLVDAFSEGSRMMSFMIVCLLLLIEEVTSVFNVQITNEATTFAAVGVSTVLNCNITGSYQGVNWSAGNTILSNGQKYQIIQSTSSVSTLISLVISDVQYSDAATYTCQAISSIDGSTVAKDSFTLSVRDKSSLLESDSLMTVYSVIIWVLSAVILIMAILMIMERIKNCWWNRLAVAIKKCFGKSSKEQIRQRIQKDEHSDILKKYGQHEIFNPADPPGFHERNIILMEEGTGRKDNQREDNQGQRLSHPSPEETDLLLNPMIFQLSNH